MFYSNDFKAAQYQNSLNQQLLAALKNSELVKTNWENVQMFINTDFSAFDRRKKTALTIKEGTHQYDIKSFKAATSRTKNNNYINDQLDIFLDSIFICRSTAITNLLLQQMGASYRIAIINGFDANPKLRFNYLEQLLKLNPDSSNWNDHHHHFSKRKPIIIDYEKAKELSLTDNSDRKIIIIYNPNIISNTLYYYYVATIDGFSFQSPNINNLVTLINVPTKLLLKLPLTINNRISIIPKIQSYDNQKLLLELNNKLQPIAKIGHDTETGRTYKKLSKLDQQLLKLLNECLIKQIKPYKDKYYLMPSKLYLTKLDNGKVSVDFDVEYLHSESCYINDVAKPQITVSDLKLKPVQKPQDTIKKPIMPPAKNLSTLFSKLDVSDDNLQVFYDQDRLFELLGTRKITSMVKVKK